MQNFDCIGRNYRDLRCATVTTDNENIFQLFNYLNTSDLSMNAHMNINAVSCPKKPEQSAEPPGTEITEQFTVGAEN